MSRAFLRDENWSDEMQAAFNRLVWGGHTIARAGCHIFCDPYGTRYIVIKSGGLWDVYRYFWFSGRFEVVTSTEKLWQAAAICGRPLWWKNSEQREVRR